MSDLPYQERLERAAAEAGFARARIITESWNAYLNDAVAARNAMPGHPVEIDVNHIIACRMALQASWAHLDAIEEQLPASQTHVRPGVEDDARLALTETGGQLAFVGMALGVEQ